MNIKNSVVELIGNTPMVKLIRYGANANLQANIVAKLELMNPGYSAKDRIALEMIEDAERRGVLKKGDTIIEPTSGNTGIGLAMAAAVKGYTLIIVMPESMSEERRKIIKAMGAKIILTPKEQGMQGAIEKAEELRKLIRGAYIPMQFENPANPTVHKRTTAKEILRDTEGKFEYFVAGVGTGGTLSGCGELFKAYNKNIKLIAVEPKESPILSEGVSGPHRIQGIGAGFVPNTLNLKMVDEVITVEYEEAKQTVLELARTEGILVGVSSGAALCAATRLARRPEAFGKTVVVVLVDTADRYFSTDLFG